MITCGVYIYVRIYNRGSDTCVLSVHACTYCKCVCVFVFEPLTVCFEVSNTFQRSRKPLTLFELWVCEKKLISKRTFSQEFQSYIVVIDWLIKLSASISSFYMHPFNTSLQDYRISHLYSLYEYIFFYHIFRNQWFVQLGHGTEVMQCVYGYTFTAYVYLGDFCWASLEFGDIFTQKCFWSPQNPHGCLALT